MPKEEILMQLSMLQQEAQKIEENLNVINQRIMEFEALKLNLEKLKEGKEILAPIGRGIFANSEIKDKKLFVSIGSNIVLKKEPKEAVEIIEKQIEQLSEMRGNLMQEGQRIQGMLQGLIEEAQKQEENK